MTQRSGLFHQRSKVVRITCSRVELEHLVLPLHIPDKFWRVAPAALGQIARLHAAQRCIHLLCAAAHRALWAMLDTSSPLCSTARHFSAAISALLQLVQQTADWSEVREKW